MRFEKAVLICCAVFLVAGCASTGKAPAVQAEPKEAATTPQPEPEQQWLSYHTAANPRSEGIVVKPVELDGSTEAPEGLAAPEEPLYGAIWAKWETPLSAEGFLWLAAGRSGEGGRYDRLYVDSNCDGGLADEEGFRPRESLWNRSTFGPVKVVFDTPDGPSAYHVNVVVASDSAFMRSGEPSGKWAISVSSAGWYEGKVSVDGREAKCALIDYNSNGAFNDTLSSSGTGDRIGFGEGADYSIGPLGRYVQSAGTLYRVMVAPDGASVGLGLAGDVPMGAALAGEDMTRIIVEGENGRMVLEPEDGRCELPAGRWEVMEWRMSRKDESGSTWLAVASAGREAPAFEVSEGGETVLPVGEPMVATVNISRSGGAYTFTEALKGSSGEGIRLLRDKSQPPAPKVRIRSADGSYDTELQFSYG